MTRINKTLWTAVGTLALAALVLAPAASADQVILDDLIVDGSICVGLDCVNGESFGFDTLRLKENNLRIKFQDTSSSASFPTNDWQITINDSSNGGANKFSIDDIDGGRTPFTIEASAPSHSLYVDDGGRIGLGTSTPVVEVHIKDGDTPTLRLEQDGSSGFTPQTWDVAGNETNFFIRDVTNGSRLPLRIRPSAPSNSIFVDTDGDIGLNTSSPQSNLTLAQAGDVNIALHNITSGADWRFQNFSDNFRVSLAGTGSAEMSLDGSGNVTFLGTVAANNGGATLPDYVFEPDYALMPLAELESFVEENKHLPNVPSQADVTAAGGTVNMSDMQYKLLEKIEELVLYTLDQQKELEALKAQMEAIEKR